MSGIFSKLERQRYCNDDQTPLAKVTDPKSGVVLDQCPRCRLIVLDDGELPAIIQAVTNVPGFRAMPSQGHGHGHGGHAPRRHHGSSGFFGDFFSS